jgi:hypothetical protein
MYQYLDKEKLHYLAELCDEEGVLGEDFFDTTEDFLEHVKENNIEYVGEIDFNVHLSEVVNNTPLPWFGKVSEGMYQIGEGVFTGHDGWVQFHEELEKEMKKKWKI